MNHRIFLRLLVLFALGIIYGAVMAPAAGAAESDQGFYGPVEQTGAIVDPEISEASGLAASSRDENLLWVINDSGNPATLFAIARDGQVRAKYTIDAPNYDWEDLAAFSLDNTAYLLIADVGDNLAGRAVCNLYIVAEPKVPDTAPATAPALLPVKWRIEFRYPDGPRDCEAVAVDARRKRVILLSKRDKPPVLYELPLLPASGVIQAEPIGPVTTIPPPTSEELKLPYGYTWSRPTAMDLSMDGNRLVVLTYKNAYAFVKQPGQSWSSVTTKPPGEIPLPYPTTGLLPIREALCIQPKTGALFITGEKPPAPVFRLQPLPD